MDITFGTRSGSIGRGRQGSASRRIWVQVLVVALMIALVIAMARAGRSSTGDPVRRNGPPASVTLSQPAPHPSPAPLGS